MINLIQKFLNSLSLGIFCFSWVGLIYAQSLPSMSSPAGVTETEQSYWLFKNAQDCEYSSWPNSHNACLQAINDWNNFVASQVVLSQQQLPSISSPDGIVMSSGLQQMFQEVEACQQNPLKYSIFYCNQLIKNWNNIVAMEKSR